MQGRAPRVTVDEAMGQKADGTGMEKEGGGGMKEGRKRKERRKVRNMRNEGRTFLFSAEVRVGERPAMLQ